jgi:hypothetical protein
MASVPPYRYSPLAGIRNCRMLRLDLNENRDSLIGELLEYAIDQDPPYSCISYTWGIADATQSIEIKGQRLSITDTVYNLLRLIRAYQRSTVPELLWIDSICINQEDIDERSQQVQHMKEIYSKAKLVHVYLGEEADGSNDIPKLYGTIIDVYGKLCEKNVSSQIGGVMEFPPLRELESIGLPNVHAPIWETHRAFLRRPWFRRKWILQEVVLARNLLFFCGPWACRGDVMVASWYISIVAQLPLVVDESGTAMGQDLPEGCAVAQILLMLDLGLVSDQKPKGHCLIDLLQRSRQGLASNPRDHVYSLLGLTSDTYRAKITIDYKESLADTYRRVAKTIVDQGDGIKLLYSIHGLDSDLDLPSWAPDWSRQGTPFFSLAPIPIGLAATEDAPHVCAGGSVSDLHIRQNGDVLVCKGYIVDVIKAVIDDPVSDELQEKLDDLFNEDCILDDQKPVERSHKGTFEIVAGRLRELVALLDRHSVYPPEKLGETVWRTAICNRQLSHQVQAPESYASLYTSFLTVFSLKKLAKYGISKISEKYRSQLVELNKEFGFIPAEVVTALIHPRTLKERDEAETFRLWANSFFRQMRSCSTQRGYLAQVPRSAMTEDVICIISGAAVPFTVRPSDKGYSLIGQCYLHGYMEGEVLHDLDIVRQDIVLV